MTFGDQIKVTDLSERPEEAKKEASALRSCDSETELASFFHTKQVTKNPLEFLKETTKDGQQTRTPKGGRKSACLGESVCANLEKKMSVAKSSDLIENQPQIREISQNSKQNRKLEILPPSMKKKEKR